MLHACSTLSPAIGSWVEVRFESLWVECEVVDAKSSWGRVRLWVKPLAGEGCQWVELSRIRVRGVEAPRPPQRAIDRPSQCRAS